MEDINIKALALLTMLETGNIEVNTNNGSVCIDAKSLDFTYIGLFGSLVCSHIIRKGVMNDCAKKLVILAGHIEQYSSKGGGITYTNF